MSSPALIRRIRRHAAAVLALAFAVALGTSGCTYGCPAALATGIVTRDGSDILLRVDTGHLMPVHWPDGIIVREEGQQLVLSDLFGNVRAREGDRIEMAGAFADESVHGCGAITVVPG